MADISNIVNVNISIDTPVSDGASFSNILLVTPVGTGTGSSNACYYITSADDLVSHGYTSSDPVYQAATVAFAQDQIARPNRVYVVGQDSTVTEGVTVEEPIADVLARAEAVVGWYGVAVAGITAAATLTAIANWVETKDKIFGLTYTSGDVPITVSNYNRTFALFAGDIDGENEVNEYAAVAWMANLFGAEPGSETWSLKPLNLISPSQLNASEMTTLKAAGVNYYVTVANKNVTIDGYMGTGEWIDVIRFRDWLKNEIQIAAFNYLSVNRKIAYNNAGITGVQNVIQSVLKEGQNIGGIDENEYDGNGNCTPGFTVTVPNAADIPKSERRSRKLNNVRFTARLAGAIHAVDIRGQLTY